MIGHLHVIVVQNSNVADECVDIASSNQGIVGPTKSELR